MCLALLNISIKEGQNLGSLQVHIQPWVCWSLRYKINVIWNFFFIWNVFHKFFISNFVHPAPVHLTLTSIPLFFFCDCSTFDVLLYLGILWIHTCQTLVSWYQRDLARWCNKVSNLLRSETMCFFASILWHDITVTHKGTEYRRLKHQHKYKLTSPVMCLQQQCVLHWMDQSLVSKIYFVCFLKVTHL